MGINQIASYSGYTPAQARWRIDRLVERGIINCDYVRGSPGERFCDKRALRKICHLKQLEDESGLGPLQAVRFLDRSWRRKALKPPRLLE